MVLRSRGRIAAALVALLVLGALVAQVVPAEAAVTQPFALRKQVNQRGDILLRGNSLLTCPTSNATCAAARTGSDGGTAANLNNNSYVMQYVDIDGDTSTSSSSSADVTLNTGAAVTWAGLYWSGYTAAVNGRTAPPAGTTQDHLKLKTPASNSYQDVTASSVYAGSTTAAAYSAFADVTSLVQAGGSGTYTGANIYADAGTDSYAAWTLVVITRDTSQPKRNLTVFDGFGVVQSGDASANVALTGFETPATGGLSARLGAVTYEGDAGLTGDSLTITPQGGSGTQLTNALNPATNVFNSTVTESGTAVAGRTPADSNTFGYDADVFDASLLFAGQTSATLKFDTGGETFFPAVATLAADVYAPDLTLTESSTVNQVGTDGRTRTGDRIDYGLGVADGNDTNTTDSANTVVTTAIPAGTSYVPGSLKVDGVAVSDATDGDQGEISGSTITVRLGTVAKNTSKQITYSVTITGAYTSGGTITSTATATSQSPTTSTQYSATSNTDTVTVDAARSDLAVTGTAAPAVIQRDGTRDVTWTATVRNNGPDPEPSPMLTQALPTGATATVTGIGVSCAGGPTYSCTLPALASGASSQVVFTGTLPSTAADPSTATATVSGANADPTAANNSDTASVGVDTKPVAAADTASLPSAKASVDTDVLANDSDPDNDPLTLQSVGTPAHGAATIVAGKVRYRLTDPSFTGTDATTYTVCDGRGGCSTQTLSITVADHSVADLGVSQAATPALVQRDGARVVTWTVTVTDVGPSGEPAPVLSQLLPAGATAVTVTGATCTPSGTTYTCPLAALDAGDAATVTFTATLPATAPDPATATATVTGSLSDPVTANNTAVGSVRVNTPPTAAADSATLSGTAVRATIAVLGNDSDADGDPLTLSTVSRPAHGTATISGSSIVYTDTDTAFEGDNTFTYTVCDGRSGCATATVVVHLAHREHAPKAEPDSATVKPGGTAVVDVLGNDTDPDGDTLGDVTIVKEPAAGKAFVDAQGKIHYTAPKGGVPGGVVTLTYRTCDASGACATSTLKFYVQNSNSAALPSTGTGTGTGTGSGSGDSDGDDLAFTGAQIWPLLTLAVALFLGGCAFLLASRRRRPALSWRSYDSQEHHRTTPPSR